MTLRATTCAVLGALAVVVGWAAWSMLGPQSPPAPLLATPAAVAQAAAPPAPVPRPVEQAPHPEVAAARAAPAVPPRPAAPLRDGLVMAHGMPTAVHALPDDGTPAIPPPVAPLPAGVRTEDATVNRAGMVALTRSASAPADGAPSPDGAPRPAIVTHAP